MTETRMEVRTGATVILVEKTRLQTTRKSLRVSAPQYRFVSYFGHMALFKEVPKDLACQLLQLFRPQHAHGTLHAHTNILEGCDYPAVIP